jgi:hypothetical protein
MKITKLLTIALFAASAALPAQEGRPYKSQISLGFALAHGHAHDMTQTTWGGLGAFAAEFGVQFKLPETNMQIRPNIGTARLLSKQPGEDSPKLYDLMGLYVGLDFVYAPFERLPVSISTGPIFHTWNVDEVNAAGNPSQGDKGMKLGWRVGAGYDINEKWGVALDFSMTEWRKDKNSTVFVPGFNPSRPSYFTVKGSYRF